jgi:pimeloyl-ACP methyl ester carboxylesterase
MEIIDPFIRRCFAFPVPEKLYTQIAEYAASLDKQIAYDCAFSVRTHDLRPMLSEITCPVLLLHGKLDKARTQIHVDDLMKGIGNIELHYLNAGHTPMVEDRDNFIKYMLDFIRRIQLVQTDVQHV